MVLANEGNMTEEIKPLSHGAKICLIGDSIFDRDHHFIIRYDANNQPNYWAVDGKIVSREEFDLVFRRQGGANVGF